MVKALEISWYGKIAEFKRQQNRTISESSAFLLDLLQGLYEDISDKVKVELLLILQEYGDVLIQKQEPAEQAVGAIKSILCFEGNHDKQYVAHCLVTTATLIIQFDLFQFNPSLVEEITQILLSKCKRVNVPGETLIRKVASECLIELETAIPLILSKNIYLLFDLSKEEKSYVSQNYMLLLSIVMQNSLHLGTDENTSLGIENEYHTAKVVPRDAQQMTSYIAGELNHLSPALLWQTGQSVSHLFSILDMPEVALQNKMNECWYSSNLQILHLGLLLALKKLHEYVNLEDLLVITECLVNKVVLPVFPNGFRAVCLEWLLEILQEISFLTDDVGSLILDLSARLSKQLALDSPYILQEKLEVLSDVLIMYPGVFDYFQCLEIPLKLANQGIIGLHLSILYRVFFLQFAKTENIAMKHRIKDNIIHLTIQSPHFMGHTINFIRAIQSQLGCSIRLDLIHQLTSFVLKQHLTNFLATSNDYFPLIELSSSEQGLWPLGIVRWMRSLCARSPISRSGDWELGSNILSICRAILANHDSLQLLHELADFLWFLHKDFNDQDIKDRALFLYLIIGHASPKYFDRIFKRSNEDGKMQLFGKKADIQVPAELVRGILPTTFLNEPFLALEKSAIYEMQQKCDTIDFQYECYESYMTILQESFETNIHLKLKVKFLSGELDSKIPTKVYALSLKFNPNGRCKDIPHIHISYLCKDKSSKGYQNDCASLKIEPHCATPFNIQACCTFTNDRGRICVAPIAPISLVFSDFFHPLVNFSEGRSNESKKRLLFGNLWEHFEQNIKTSKASPKSCATSVKRLIIADRDIANILEKNWQPFIIEKNGKDCKIGIFLSPSYHLLMKMTISKEQTVIRFCIDNWKLLDIVEDYFESILSVKS